MLYTIGQVHKGYVINITTFPNDSRYPVTTQAYPEIFPKAEKALDVLHKMQGGSQITVK